jgi:hypothetical protein
MHVQAWHLFCACDASQYERACMHAYIHTYMLLYVCMYVCMYVCIFELGITSMHMSKGRFLSVKYARISHGYVEHACIQNTLIHTTGKHTNTHAYVHTRMCAHTHRSICINTCMHRYILKIACTRTSKQHANTHASCLFTNCYSRVVVYPDTFHI